MLRNWNVLKLSSLMAVAVAVAPLPAPAAARGPGDTGQTELEKLTESVKKLTKACDDQKEMIDKQKETLTTINDKLDKLIGNTTKGFDGINSDLNKIKDDIKALNEDSTDTKLKLATAQAKIKSLEEQMVALKSDINKLLKREPSLYPGVSLDDIKTRLEKIETTLARLAEGRTAYSPPAGVGRIQLANYYPEEVLFVINGKAQRVPPNGTLDLTNQPVGVFTYEVISGRYGRVAQNSPMLEAGKVYTITVR